MKKKIEKEKIEKKLEVLQKSKEKYIGQINAINGAIQALGELLQDEPIEEVEDG